LAEEVPGEMREFDGSNKRETKQDFWSMCQWKEKFGDWSHSRALAAYKNKFGVWPKGLHEVPMPPTIEFDRAVKAGLIRFIKAKQKGLVK
jgi:hypothetical protein